MCNINFTAACALSVALAVSPSTLTTEMPSSSAKAVFTAEAPAPSPLMSQAVVHTGMVYFSGSLGIDPATNDFVKGTFQDRVVCVVSRHAIVSGRAKQLDQRQSLANLEKVLLAANSNLKNVVKVDIFITSPQLFAPLNEVYAEIFKQEVKPVCGSRWIR